MQKAKFLNSISFKLVNAILFLPVLATIAGFVLFQHIEHKRICQFSAASLTQLEQTSFELMVRNQAIFKEMILRIASDNQIIVPFKLNVKFQLQSYMALLRQQNQLDALALVSQAVGTDNLSLDNYPESTLGQKFASHFKAALNGENRTFYTEYNFEKPQLYLVALTPILSNNKVIAVLFAARKVILSESFNQCILVANSSVQSASRNSLFIKPFIKEIDKVKSFGKIYLSVKELFFTKTPIPNFKHQDYYLISGVNGKKVFEENKHIMAISAGVCFLVVLLLIAYSFFLSRRLTRPLTELVAISNAVSANKKNVKWINNRDDEFGVLSNALKTMTDNLQKTIGELNLANNNVKDSNATLEKYRQNLENMVDERTIELKNTLKNLQNTQAQLLQSEKMASIGQLAAGIAHEINNPVGFVNSNINSLSKYIDDIMGLTRLYDDLMKGLNNGEEDKTKLVFTIEKIQAYKKDIDIEFINEDINEIINDCLNGMERIKNIVQGLKDFAHPGDEEFICMDIEVGIESTLNVIANELKYKASVIKNYGELRPVLAIPQQINQVFMNIFVNAVQAMTEPGTINIKTGYENNNNIIEISDTGSGILSEHIPKIFDPFFTTKDVGQGTGLGMNIAYNIIKKHEGTITIKSTVGKGTTFIIKLPTVEDC